MIERLRLWLIDLGMPEPVATEAIVVVGVLVTAVLLANLFRAENGSE